MNEFWSWLAEGQAQHGRSRPSVNLNGAVNPPEGQYFRRAGREDCIAPSQIKLAHAAFSPDSQEREYAARLVTAYEEAISRGIGTIDFEGKMVDGPVLKRAL